MSKTLNILVCDDSKVSRIMSVGLLKKLQPQCSTLEACNADEALALLAAHPVQLMLVDQNMPGTSGLDLAEALAGQYPNLRIALLTANVQESTQIRAAKLGVDFFRKPISQAVIAAILERVAGHANSSAP